MENGEGDHEQLRSVGWFITGLCPDEKTVRVTTNRFFRWAGLTLGCVLVENGKGDHEQLRSVDRFSAGVVSGEAVLAGTGILGGLGWGRMFHSLWGAKSQDGVLKSQTSKKKESLRGESNRRCPVTSLTPYRSARHAHPRTAGLYIYIYIYSLEETGFLSFIYILLCTTVASDSGIWQWQLQTIITSLFSLWSHPQNNHGVV